jgi:hypothetical protein
MTGRRSKKPDLSFAGDCEACGPPPHERRDAEFAGPSSLLYVLLECPARTRGVVMPGSSFFRWVRV